VAGGIGITPFLAALRTQTLTVPTHLLYLYPNVHDAAYLDELRARATCQPLLTLDLRATGNELPDINALLPSARALQGVTSYLCGPPGLMQTVLHALQEKGIPLHHIHSERFDFR
jgi:predicted ferric reductase